MLDVDHGAALAKPLLVAISHTHLNHHQGKAFFFGNRWTWDELAKATTELRTKDI